MSGTELFCPSLGKAYPLLLAVWPDTAALVGMTRSQTYEAVKSGDIPSIRIGGRIRVPTAKLLEALGVKVSLSAPAETEVAVAS